MFFRLESLFFSFLRVLFDSGFRIYANNLFRIASIAPPEVLCASSCGFSKVKFEFWSQCKVLLLSSIYFVYFLSLCVLIQLQSETHNLKNDFK